MRTGQAFFATMLAVGAAAAAQAFGESKAAASCADSNALVYVASADSGPVAAYAATATGAVSPSLVVQNPNVTGTVWDPWGVAFDTQGDLYVQSFLSNATSFVFAPNASGAASPIRLFRGGGPDTRAIIVDSTGFETIATSQQASELLMLPPGAAGIPSNSYAVTPIQTIQTDETPFHPWPSLLAVDSANEIAVAVVRSSGNAIEVFLRGGLGDAAAPTPLRVVTGPDTGLGSCGTSCDELAIAFSPAAAGFFVGVSSTSGTHINLFAQGAAGDAIPLRTIAGPTTGLTGNVITGLAVSPCTGDIFAMVKSGQFANGQILVFDAAAQGDSAPKRTFVDAANAFADAQGIAVNVPAPVRSTPALAPWATAALFLSLFGAAATRVRPASPAA
jgi:hypothetical protein